MYNYYKYNHINVGESCEMKYFKRICDNELIDKLDAFGAVHIIGPKWCGKTTTAKQFVNSYIEMQDPDMRDAYIHTANIKPSNLLIGDKPRLIDEWQIAPNLWDAVRVAVDRANESGQYVLTGSNSIDKTEIMHTGTGRIDTLQMYPMSLYESGESNGTVSLSHLFQNKELEDKECVSNLSIDELIIAACRGGWPSTINKKNQKSKLMVANSYFDSLCRDDINNIDNTKRDEQGTRLLLKSYARNISTFATNRTILKDINANFPMGETTFYDYVKCLQKLFVIKNVEAWCPSIRSKTAIQSTEKKEFTDPSIAVAALGVSPEYFNTDLRSFGFIFETLCIRDLRVYSSSLGGNVSYYHDRYGLEADAVLHLRDGRYALIEIKLGSNEIEEGASHLNEIERLIKAHNDTEKQVPLRLPDLKIVLTGTPFGYKRDDGVFVIPIGCLKN